MKKGFTLIEITIALMIIGILLVPVVLFFNQTIKNYTYGRPDTKTVEVVTDAMNEIETLLRQGYLVDAQSNNSYLKIFIKSNYFIEITYDSQNYLIKRGDSKYIPYYNNLSTPISERVKIIKLEFKYYGYNNNPNIQDNSEAYAVEIIIEGQPYTQPGGSLGDIKFELKTMVKLRNKN